PDRRSFRRRSAAPSSADDACHRARKKLRPASRARASARGLASAAFAPARVQPQACRSSAGQSSPFYRFPSVHNREHLGRAGRAGSLVPGSGWGSCSRRRRLPEELQATDQVLTNPSINCSLFVTITCFVTCTVIWVRHGQCQTFLCVRDARPNRTELVTRNEGGASETSVSGGDIGDGASLAVPRVRLYDGS